MSEKHFVAVPPLHRPGHIVWAEDTASDRMLIEEALREGGWLSSVEFARDGAEALHLVSRWRPRLLALDFENPGMDGLRTVRRLRAHPQASLRRLPVVNFSAKRLPTALEQELGVLEHIEKPVHWLPLLAQVGRILALADGGPRLLPEDVHDKDVPPWANPHAHPTVTTGAFAGNDAGSERPLHRGR